MISLQRSATDDAQSVAYALFAFHLANEKCNQSIKHDILLTKKL